MHILQKYVKIKHDAVNINVLNDLGIHPSFIEMLTVDMRNISFAVDFRGSH